MQCDCSSCSPHRRENELRWQETGIEGAVRFLRRVYGMVFKWRDAVAVVSSPKRRPSQRPRALEAQDAPDDRAYNGGFRRAAF